MKIVALVEPGDARGFRLAGIEAEVVPPQETLVDRLRAITARSDVGLAILSPSVAARVPEAVEAFRFAGPPFVVVLPEASAP